MTKMPTPFLFKKAQKPTARLTELKEPQIDLVSGGITDGADPDLVDTWDVWPDGTTEWCTKDDEW